MYLKWTSDDVIGFTGNRDEIGLDNITLNAHTDPIPIPVINFNSELPFYDEELELFPLTSKLQLPMIVMHLFILITMLQVLLMELILYYLKKQRFHFLLEVELYKQYLSQS